MDILTKLAIAFMIYLGIGLLLLQPTFNWLVKHRWAIDKEMK